MFRSIFDKARFTSEVGSRFAPTYGVVYDDNGVRSLKQKGTKDIYSEIQSHKDACDIHTIIDRFQQTGDTSLLSRRPAFFADMTEMPQTVPDMLNAIADATAYFNKLPVEIKSEFNNSPEQFMAAMDDSDFIQRIKKHVPNAFKDDKKDEVKPQEVANES